MYWLWDLIFVFIIACIGFGAVYALAVRPTYASRAAVEDDPAADIGCLWLVFLFFLFFFPIWGGGLWIDPIGPDIGGSYLVNFIIIAAIIFLFFGVVWSLIPGTEFAWEGGQDDSDAGSGWGALFWLFVLILIGVIIFGYLYSSPEPMSEGTGTTRSTMPPKTIAAVAYRSEHPI